MTRAEADRQNVEDFANESAELLRRALVEAARRRAEAWEQVTGKPMPVLFRKAGRPKSKETGADPTLPQTEPTRPRLTSARARNGRKPALYELNGELKSMKDWCHLYGISLDTVVSRLKTMSLEEALTRPVSHVRRAR